ncbi:HK97 family phage prohead protease [Sphingomonas sp.]|uniref:HK97 family phage prohead protease n=1 Tax=Sphingomonas sp. TaxID=28214 RepID=UPI0025E05E09|nr:HK97 family phage prohead protease [Sphingomonas sp.]
MRFAGYVAVFDREDRGGDVIRKGAFAGELSKPVTLLWQHDQARPIGAVEMLAEDDRGLRIIGRVSDDAGVVAGSGLSFGYRVRAALEGTKRELTALELLEVSVVSFPMQPLARVHAIDFTKENDDGL